MTGRISNMLLTVSGADRGTLRQAPKERTKQVAMGAVLLSTAGIAVVSASYAMHIALRLPVLLAILGGLVWGLIILNLDRWLVVSTPRLGTAWGTLAMAVPRVLLAVLIGVVVSTPLTLAVFRGEIDAELTVMAQEEQQAFADKMAGRTAEIDQLQAEVDRLTNALADGVSEADVLGDDAVIDLRKQVDAARARYDAAAVAVQCENDGTCGTGVAGFGEVSRQKVAERDRLQQEWQTLSAQLAALQVDVRTQLEDEDKALAVSERSDLGKRQAELAEKTASRAADTAANDQATDNGDGILARLSALGRIQDRDPMLATAHWMLFLFMTALECLPILFKTMLSLAPPSLYERLVALEDQRAEARVRLRMQTDYEEAETLARSALTAAEARAARTLEAESKATGIVLDAQLAVTRESVRRWRDEQRQRAAAGGSDTAIGPEGDAPEAEDEYLSRLEAELAATADSSARSPGAATVGLTDR